MKTYRLKDDELLWKDEEGNKGAIPDGEIGEHSIEGKQIRGTHVEGPFRVKGERKPCPSGLVLLDKGIRSYFIEEPDPNAEG